MKKPLKRPYSSRLHRIGIDAADKTAMGKLEAIAILETLHDAFSSKHGPTFLGYLFTPELIAYVEREIDEGRPPDIEAKCATFSSELLHAWERIAALEARAQEVAVLDFISRANKGGDVRRG